VAPLPPLTGGYYFQAVAALGNDRTFVAAASQGRGHGCSTVLWRFALTPKGQPTGLRPLLPKMPGELAYNTSLAASADGRVIAYATNNCTRRLAGQVVVIHLATAAVRTWSTRFPSYPHSLSLTADGALLGFVSNPTSGPPVASPPADSAWVLRTGSRPGPLADHYRRVLHVPNGVSSAVLSRSGATLFAVTPEGPDHRNVGAYVTATGRPIGLLHVPPRPFRNPYSLAADVAGDYAIVCMIQLNDIQELNLATGQHRPVLVNPDDSPLGIAW
jgi:hypothetical protein